jgi:hypothetical protein
MKKFWNVQVALLIALWVAGIASVIALPTTSQIGFVQYGAIPATDTTVNLHGAFRALQIYCDPASADLYVEIHNTTATVNGATCIHIPPGGNWQSPTGGTNLGVTSIHVIGSAAVGKYNICAF